MAPLTSLLPPVGVLFARPFIMRTPTTDRASFTVTKLPTLEMPACGQLLILDRGYRAFDPRVP